MNEDKKLGPSIGWWPLLLVILTALLVAGLATYLRMAVSLDAPPQKTSVHSQPSHSVIPSPAREALQLAKGLAPPTSNW